MRVRQHARPIRVNSNFISSLQQQTASPPPVKKRGRLALPEIGIRSMHQSKKELPPPAATGCSRRLSALSIAAIIWPLNGLAAEPVQVAEPQEILGPPWLDGRREAQQKTAGDIGVFHEFRFSDEVEASGITFEHRIVDDAGRELEAQPLRPRQRHGDRRRRRRRPPRHLLRHPGRVQRALPQPRGGAVRPLRKPVRTSPSPTASGLPPSFADTDNDGDPDLFVTSVRGGNALLANDGQGLFRDISHSSGLDYSGHSSRHRLFSTTTGTAGSTPSSPTSGNTPAAATLRL